MLEHLGIQQRFRVLLVFTLACFTLCGLIVYRTLSAVAKRITGTHTNGFLFFRLGEYGGVR